MAGHSATLDISIVSKVIGAAAVASFGKSLISAASDAEQAGGAVEAVFKGNAAAVKAWSDKSAAAIGLSKTDYQTLATTIGSQLKNAGTSMNDLAPQTDKLITMGADLAAQYGGSTSDAVSALSSLLKGERDPIEKYGVSITAAAVAAKKAEMGLGGLTGAADAAATQQATLALLTTQTADALGANAREADTAAGKQARLTAAWSDAKAQIGGALLPAFSSLMGAATDLLPVFLPLVQAAADLAGAVAKLPAPLLLAAAGMAAFLKYGSGAGKTLSAMRAGTTSAGDGFKSLGKSLALGGAVGLATAALSTIIGAFAAASAHTKELQGNTKSLADELVSSGGKWTQAASDIQKSQMESSKGFALAKKSGLSYADTMDLLSGKLQGTTKQTQLLEEVSGNTSRWDRWTNTDAGLGLDELTKGLKGQREEATKSAAEMIAYTAAQAKANAALDATAAAAKATKPTVAELAKAQAEANAAATKAAAAYNAGAVKVADLKNQQIEAAAASTTLGAELTKAGGAADAAKRAADGLGLALDKLSGRNQTAEQAAANLNKSLTGLKDGFTAATGEAGVNNKALLAWNVPALTATATGQKAFDSLNNVRDAYQNSTAAAFSSTNATKGVTAGMAAGRAAADAARTAFINNAASMGLNKEQARTLADKLGILEGKKITDKEFDVIGKDADAQQKLKDLQAKQITQKTVKVNADTTQAERDLANLERSRTMTIYAKTVAAAGGNLGPSAMPGAARGTDGAALMGLSAEQAAAAPFAAPGVPIRVRVNVPTTGNVVNVYGALDPVAVGRQVSTLLTGQDRRGGGPRIGGRA